MTRDTDPKRIRASEGNASPRLADAIACARADGPSPAQLAAMRMALGLHGPHGGGEGAPPGPSAPKAIESALVKPMLHVSAKGGAMLAAAACLLAALGGFGAGSVRAPREARAAQSERVRDTPMVEATPVLTKSQAISAQAEIQPPAPIAPPARPASNARRRGARALVPSNSQFAEELLLLERANASLVSRPQRSLALAREHRQRFQRGVLVEEREMLAVQALIRLGRLDDARRRADALRAAYPHTAYGERLTTLLHGLPHVAR